MCIRDSLNPKATFPITKANPPAKKAPTTQEKIIGRPNPPRKPVFAGSTFSIASIPGSDTKRIIIIPKMIIVAIK